MSAIAWSTVEAAIQSWVASATGFAADRVIWTDKGGPRPPAPYVGLSISTVVPVGRDWRVYDDAPDPQPGAELRVRARGMRVSTLSMQCFALDGAGDAAVRSLSDVVSAIPLHEYAIDLAGAGLGDIRPVQLVQGHRGSILEPRAVVDLDMHLASELEGRETYIERIQLTATVKTATGTPLGAVETWIPSPPP